MSYHYYGRHQSRAKETLALGDIVPFSRASLLEPNEEMGLGDYSTAGRLRPSGPPRWGVGGWLYGDSSAVAQAGIPVWDGLSKNVKIALAFVAIGGFLWWSLGKKMPLLGGSKKRRRNSTPRPVCSACKDTLNHRDNLHMTANGKKVCDACKIYGKAARTFGKPKSNPRRRRRRSRRR